MSHTVKRIARATTSKLTTYTGPAGELVMDTTTNGLRLMDGVTAGGRQLLTAHETQTITGSKTFSNPVSVANATANGHAVNLSQLTTAVSSQPAATDTTPGLMSAADKAKLDGIAAGATAINDSTLVHLAGAETISGQKTFGSRVLLGGSVPGVSGVHSSYAKGGALASGETYKMLFDLQCYDNSGTLDAAHSFAAFHSQYTTGATQTKIRGYKNVAASEDFLDLVLQYNNTDQKFVFATGNTNANDVALGSGGNKWANIYAVNGTIITSDERSKTEIADIPEAVLRAWGKVKFQQFRMKDAVEKKGQAARLHIGVIVQRIDEAFRSEGLDARNYGLFCFDSWDAEPEIRDERGNVISPARAAGESYAVRYEECLALECAYQRWRMEKLEERLTALEG